MPGALIRLVQGSLLLPSTALFIGLLPVTCSTEGLVWPGLAAAGGA